jgi:NitT/TauT family transport system substrate-binding protein
VSLLAAACGSAAATGRAGPEKPDLTVAVVPAISAAGLYIAAQRGYFTAAGLHVKIVPIASGVNALAGLAVLVTNIMLQSHGVPVSSVHYTVMGFPDMGAALASHKVDAAFIAEPSLSAAVDTDGAQSLFDVDQGPTHNIPISGYVTTAAWAAKYPRTAAAFVQALERGQQVAASDRAAVGQALIPALHISKTTAAVMALGSFPLSVNSVALARVADLMQENGLLAKTVNTKTVVRELIGS